MNKVQDPALVAPESYVADRAEILREMARLVSEHALPAPMSYQVAGTINIRLEDDNCIGVDAWATQLGLPEPKTADEIFGQDTRHAWCVYGVEWLGDNAMWLGWPVTVWTRHSIGGES